MSDDLESIIKDVATKHGVAVAIDDPLMIIHTIVLRVFQDAEKIQQERLDAFKEELELVSYRWGEDTKAKAEKILNAALVASKEAMREAALDTAKAASASVKTEIERTERQLSSPLKDAARLTKMNIVCAVFTMIASAITLFSTFH